MCDMPRDPECNMHEFLGFLTVLGHKSLPNSASYGGTTRPHLRQSRLVTLNKPQRKKCLQLSFRHFFLTQHIEELHREGEGMGDAGREK